MTVLRHVAAPAPSGSIIPESIRRGHFLLRTSSDFCHHGRMINGKAVGTAPIW
jgi:hypothetical protein